MNTKKAKKLRQYYRRDLRSKLGLEEDIAMQLIKPRSKWFPKILWNLGARIYFDTKLYHAWFNNKK